MKTQKTILVPTDFSQKANIALDQAVYLAHKIEAKLIVYHVYHRPVAGEKGPSTLSELEKNIEASFKKLLKTRPELNALPHEFKKELGVSVDNIVKLVNSQAIDMLVMATKGAKGFDELWGTKTAKIIKMVETPVFVIPDKTSLKQFEKVSLACDYSHPTDPAEIAFLAQLAESLDITVDVVTLNRDEKTMTKKEVENREQLIAQMGNVKASFSYTQHPNVEEGIIAYCQSNNIDAIAVLSKSYSFIERLFHESLTDKMIFHSPIPLLVL